MVGTKQGDGLGAGGVTINDGEGVMSREIKFRAWDGERMLFMGKGGFCDFELSGGDVYVSKYGLGFSESDYPLMQYTGLKDRRGVEIYEGDILQLPDCYTCAPVKWEQSSCSYTCFGRLCKYQLDPGPDNQGLTVIGNIYETPELLEGGE